MYLDFTKVKTTYSLERREYRLYHIFFPGQIKSIIGK